MRRLVFKRAGIRLGYLLFCLLLVTSPAVAQPDLLDGMTLEQRIGQLFMVQLYGDQLTGVGRDFLTRYQPGGVVLIGDNAGTPAAVAALVNDFQAMITGAGGKPLFIAIDQEPGPIQRLRDGFTQFPTPALITATGDPQLAFEVGAAMAAELRAVGINMNLAPVADLETNPTNPIIVRRSFGSDPAQVSPMVAAYAQGLQSGGVLAVAKHFPGHGASASDSHVELPVIDLPRDWLEQVELAPFRAAVNGGGEAVMMAHIWYPALEPTPELPASLSPAIITGLLRHEMGFDGLILTDALDMDAIDTRYSYAEAVQMAIEAGVDIVLSAHIGPSTQIEAIESLAAAVRAGELSEARINESARRILEAKARFGLLDWSPIDPNTINLPLADHGQLVDTLFQRGVSVALDRDGRIPFALDQTVQMIYPGTRPDIQVDCTPLRPDARWMSVSLRPTDEQRQAAVIAAGQADQVVVFTENAGDRLEQAALVKALPQDKVTVVALWSVYDYWQFPGIAAYLVIYSPQQPGVPAACGLLFGSNPARAVLSLQGVLQLP
jgi:beta-N-acetylhexosaminidase